MIIESGVNQVRSWRQSVWFAWLVVTLIYLPLWLAAATSGQGVAERQSNLIGYPATAVGLFVPFGVGNFMYGVLSVLNPFEGNPLRFLSLPLAILLFHGCERLARHWELSGWQRVGLNLLFLFVATIAVDLMIAGQWTSAYLFLSHDVLGGCC